MSLFQSKSAEGGASPPRRPKEGHSSAPAENVYLVRKEETTQDGGGASTEETNRNKKKHRVVQCRVVRAFSGSRADELHLVPGDTVMVTRRQASSHSLWWHGYQHCFPPVFEGHIFIPGCLTRLFFVRDTAPVEAELEYSLQIM